MKIIDTNGFGYGNNVTVIILVMSMKIMIPLISETKYW